MTATLVVNSGYDKEVERAIIEEIKAKGASEMEVFVEVVPEIPVPESGKRRYIISDYSKKLLDEKLSPPSGH